MESRHREHSQMGFYAFDLNTRRGPWPSTVAKPNKETNKHTYGAKSICCLH